MLDVQNYDGDTALIGATCDDHTTVVTALIKAGAALEVQNKNGDTALIVAAARGHINMVRKLIIAAGADVTIVGEQGKTALQWARMRNNAEVAALLASTPAVAACGHRTLAGHIDRVTPCAGCGSRSCVHCPLLPAFCDRCGAAYAEKCRRASWCRAPPTASARRASARWGDRRPVARMDP